MSSIKLNKANSSRLTLLRRVYNSPFRDAISNFSVTEIDRLIKAGSLASSYDKNLVGNAYTISQFCNTKQFNKRDRRFNELEFEVAQMELCQKQYFEELLIYGDSDESSQTATIKSLINEIKRNKDSLLYLMIDVAKYIKKLQKNYQEFKDTDSEIADSILADYYFEALYRTKLTKEKYSSIAPVRQNKNISNVKISKLSNPQKMIKVLKANIAKNTSLFEEIEKSTEDEVLQLIKECSIASGFKSQLVLSAYCINLVSIRDSSEYVKKTADLFNRSSEVSRYRPTQIDFFIHLIVHGYFIHKEETYRVLSLIKKIRNKNLAKNLRLLDVVKYELLLRKNLIFRLPIPIIREDKAYVEKLYFLASKDIEKIVYAYRRVDIGKQRKNKSWKLTGLYFNE